MKLIFAGTPVFAAQALEALIAAGHDVVQVLTQPDRPAGRGMKLQPSAVKLVALAQGIPVYQPVSLKTAEAQAALLEAEVMVVAAYGLLLPQAVLDHPQQGCLNIHASLLPRWRGAAPIQRSLLAGDTETGITIMQMDAGLDTGAMLSVHRLPITPEDTTETLHDCLASLGAEAIVAALNHLPALQNHATPQPEGACYAAKITKEEAQIDWTHSAVDIDRMIRAYSPFPGALTHLKGEGLKLWKAHPLSSEHGEAGHILRITPESLVIGTGSGALAVELLQKAGGKKLAVSDFLRGTPLEVGMQFK